MDVSAAAGLRVRKAVANDTASESTILPLLWRRILEYLRVASPTVVVGALDPFPWCPTKPKELESPTHNTTMDQDHELDVHEADEELPPSYELAVKESSAVPDPTELSELEGLVRQHAPHYSTSSRASSPPTPCSAHPHAPATSTLESTSHTPSPIHTIPLEIFREIFAFYVHSGFSPIDDRDDLPPFTQAEWMAPLILSHVCRHWRTALFTYPQAWTNIRIAPTRRDASLGLRAWLQLSGDQPLHVVVDDYRLEGRFPDNALLSMFRDLVSSGRSIRSIVLSVKPHLLHSFEDIIAVNPSVMHSLQGLHFDLFPTPKYHIPTYQRRWELWQPQDPTVLHRLSLSFVPMHDLLLSSSYATLSCLDLHGHMVPSIITILDTLKECLMLDTLNLQVEVVDVDVVSLLRSSDSRTRTKLHNLKHLTIRDDAEHSPGVWHHFGSSWILVYLELPTLETLSLHWTRGCKSTRPPNIVREESHRFLLGSEISKFLRASKPQSLHTLSLYACEVTTADISRWLSAIPSLKRLYIHAISPDQQIYNTLLRYHPRLEQLCVGRIPFFYPLQPLLDFISAWVLGTARLGQGIEGAEQSRSRVLSVGCTEENVYQDLKSRAEQVREPEGCVELGCVPVRFPFWRCAVYEPEPWKITSRFVRFCR